MVWVHKLMTVCVCALGLSRRLQDDMIKFSVVAGIQWHSESAWETGLGMVWWTLVILHCINMT